VPAGHRVQVAAKEDVDPLGPKEPAGQMTPVQIDEPLASEKVPGGQSVHVAASEDVCPVGP
jgi:hypothetical protein